MYYFSHNLIKEWYEVCHSLDGNTSQRAVDGSGEEIVILIHESVASLRSDHCDPVCVCFCMFFMLIEVLSPDRVGHEGRSFEVKLARGFDLRTLRDGGQSTDALLHFIIAQENQFEYLSRLRSARSCCCCRKAVSISAAMSICDGGSGACVGALALALGCLLSLGGGVAPGLLRQLTRWALPPPRD